MNRKHTILLLFFASLFPALIAQDVSLQTIGNIEKRGVWYDIYNEQGEKMKTIQANIGELVGFGEQFFIVKHGYWYDLYDITAKKYKTLQTSIGEIVSVASNSFIVLNGIWLHTYNSEGKKISTRQTNTSNKKQ